MFWASRSDGGLSQQAPSVYGDTGGATPQTVPAPAPAPDPMDAQVVGANSDPAWLTALVTAGQKAAVDVIGQVAGAVTGRNTQATKLEGTTSGQAKSVAAATTSPAWRSWLPWLIVAAVAVWFLRK